MSRDNIIEALGIRPVEELEERLPIEALEPDDQPEDLVGIDEDEDETIADLETAKTNAEELLKQGSEALQDILSLARQGEMPGAFDVASKMMKTLLDANKQFADLAVKKREVKTLKDPQTTTETNPPTGPVTNNNLIVTTTELVKMLKGNDAE